MAAGSIYSRDSGGSFRDFLRLYSTALQHSIAVSSKDIAKHTKDISNGLDKAIHGIESLGAAMNHGMLAQLGQLEAQNKTLSSQLQKLESIDEALRNPDAVRAKEWFIRGEDLLAKGLFDMALEAFGKSADIYGANHLVQLNLGRLRLFGVDEDCDVTDVGKAIEHLALAARIAKAEARIDAAANGSCAECYFYLSFAYYLAGNERHTAKDGPGSEESYREAAKSAKTALEYSPRFSEARYQLCKCLALLGEREASLDSAKMLVTAKPEYAAKLKADGDMSPLADEFAKVAANATGGLSEREKLRAACDESVLWAKSALRAGHVLIDTMQGPDDAFIKKLRDLESKELKGKISSRDRSALIDMGYSFCREYAFFIEGITGMDDNDERFMKRYKSLYTDPEKAFYKLLYENAICYVEVQMKSGEVFRISPSDYHGYVSYHEAERDDDYEPLEESYTRSALFGTEVGNGAERELALEDMAEMRLKWNPWAHIKQPGSRELQEFCDFIAESSALGLLPLGLTYIDLSNPEGQLVKTEKAVSVALSIVPAEGACVEYVPEGGSKKKRLNLGLLTNIEAR